MTEAIPIPATALLQAVFLPVFHIVGVQSKALHEFTARNALVYYANPVIYTFLGGFLIAAGMQKWHMDRRLTLWLLTRGKLANNAGSVLFAVMGVTAFLSMWISNTATTAMMLPLGAPTRASSESHSPTGSVLLLIPIAWFLLLKVNPPEIDDIPGGRERFLRERESLGAHTTGEKRMMGVFLVAVFLWISNPFWDALLPADFASRLSWVDEYVIGLGAGLFLFFIPVSVRDHTFLLDWKDTRFVDWGTLILFGGGIALSDAMFKTGLAAFLATSFVGLLGSPSTLVMMFAVVLLISFLTEVTSNTAVTAMMVPIVISIAVRTGENPVALALAAAVSASMAFMLPVATPPNALVFSTGYVKIKDMIRSGFILEIIGWLTTVGIMVVFANWLFGIVRF